MADSFVQLPLDTGNTGKKVRTQTRVVGADTVHEHYMILTNEASDVQCAVVTDGSAAGTTGLHALGTDGTNAQIISTNASGHVNIADGSNSITVDGTVSVSGAVDTELPAAAALTDNFVNPTAPGVGSFGMVWDGATWDRAPGTSADGMLVNLGANNDVTVTGALPAGTNNIGDVDVLTVPAPLSTTGGGTEATALRVTVANDSTGLLSVDDNAGSLTVDAPVATPVAVRVSDGAAFVDARDLNNTTKTLKQASISVAASGDNTIVAAVASKRIKVHAVNLSSTGTVSAKWKDGAATDITGAQDLQAREGYAMAVSVPSWIMATSAGNALILNLSGAVGVRGWVAYWDDDAT